MELGFKCRTIWLQHMCCLHFIVSDRNNLFSFFCLPPFSPVSMYRWHHSNGSLWEQSQTPRRHSQMLLLNTSYIKMYITTSGWANSQVLVDDIYFSLHFLSLLTPALLQMCWMCPDYSIRWSGCWIGLTLSLWHHNQSVFIPYFLELLQNNSESLSLTWEKWMPSLRSCFIHSCNAVVVFFHLEATFLSSECL